MAISKEILAFVRMQLDKASADAVSSAITKITDDVGKLEAATKKQAASAISVTSKQQTGKPILALPPGNVQNSAFQQTAGGKTWASGTGKIFTAAAPQYSKEQLDSMKEVIQ